MEQMNRKIGNGVAWNLISLLLSRGSSTIFTLFLARLLAPEAFGLIAMIMIVMELAQHFVQSGLGEALIRSKVASEADFSTIFHANLGLSALAYALLFMAAPWLADFYSQSALTDLLRVMGLVVFLNALKVVPTAMLSRQMNFRSQMVANTSGVLVSGLLAVFVAWQGGGVWSLVVQAMVNAGISALLLWYMTSWLPKLMFSGESFRRLFGFGVNLLAVGTIRILVQNSHVIAISRLFSAEVTGLYFFAKKVSQLISQQLSAAVQNATFPAMAKLQDDNAALRHKYRQIIQLMMFIIAPVMALLAALADPLFTAFLGEKWSGAVVYFQLLCVVATLYPLHSMNINVLKVKGRSDLVLKIGLLKNGMSLALLFAMIPFGVFWILVGQVANSFVSLIPNTYFTFRLIDYGVKQQILDIAKPVLAASLAGLSAYMVMEMADFSPLGLLLLGVFTGSVVFLVLSILIGVEAIKIFSSKIPFR
jgi:O-antigen/teichoic acid export membrane protein